MIRDYKEADFGDCLHLVNNVWDFDKHFSPPELSKFFQRIYTGSSLAGSNFLKVVEEDNQIKGFLFGKIENQALYKNEFSGIWRQLKVLFKLLRFKGVHFNRKLTYLKYINVHERNRRKAEPRKNSEITLFVVNSESQGKGFGKILLNEFISSCHKNNVKRIILETDQESNYGFYEHIGFKIKGRFYSPLLKEFSGGSGETFIYELELQMCC